MKKTRSKKSRDTVPLIATSVKLVNLSKTLWTNNLKESQWCRKIFEILNIIIFPEIIVTAHFKVKL
jgi:hypothetical protein